jgi:drug/metabolite transporter (DMT)-like permease
VRGPEVRRPPAHTELNASHPAPLLLMPRLALLLTTVIWGATFPATKAALEQITPLSFLLLRFFIGTLLILAWLAVSRRRLHYDRAVLKASALTTVFLFFGYLLQTVGLEYTTASNSA